MTDLNVLIWNEFIHEKSHPTVQKLHPRGIHETIGSYLRGRPGLSVQTAVLEQPDHGLTSEAVEKADVLLWWGHAAHDRVRDDIVDRVQKRVLDGMGLIVLHSGHYSKIFRRLMGTTCLLRWREAAERERLWVVNPAHPIARGLGPFFELEPEEMYGEHFDVPEPDEVVFIGWFEGGEVFRSGCTWTRGRGKVFYFQPGHETYPSYHNPKVLRVIENAVRWAAFAGNDELNAYGKMCRPIEKISEKSYEQAPLEHPVVETE
jgi:trehalose utilization protein